MPRNNKILIRSGTVAPTASDFAVGEPAFDKSAGKLYIKNAAGAMVELGTGGGGGGTELFPYANAASFPGTGVTTALYLSIASGRVYQWNGSVYSEVGPVGGGDPRMDLFLPPAPTSVTASAGNGQSPLAWTAPSVLSQTPITDYVVQYSSNSGSTWTNAAESVAITSQPTNQTASSGAATFSVTASVTPSGTTATYQWERSDNGGTTFAAVSGATSATLSLTSLTNASDNNDQYRVVVSAVGAASVTSNAVTLTVAASTPPLSLAGTRPSNLASGTTSNGYTLTGTGTSGSPSVLRIGGGSNNDYRVWLIVNQTGTLNWTVTASSEAGYDGGRLYSAGAPANYTAGGFNNPPPAGYTAISSWLSGGADVQTGSTSVTSGQHIVLQWVKDDEVDAGSNRIELSAYIS